ncbi:MAG: efflux RND transporter permease subunit [Bdellovibrio bacteriovorus]
MVALAVSLVVAITVTPVLCYYLLPRDRSVRAGRAPRLVTLLKRLYAPLLAVTLTRCRAVTASSLVLPAVALAALTQAGQTFLPGFSEGSLTILANTPPGTALERSDALAAQLQEIPLEQPKVVATARHTGRTELAEHSLEVNSTEIEVTLDLKGAGGGRDPEAFIGELRERLAGVPGLSVTIGQPISHRVDHMLSGTRASIAVKVFGDDLYELRRIATAIEARMSEVPGVVDLMVEQQADIPVVTVSMRRGAIARHGLRVRDVANAIETAFYGRVLSKALEGQTIFDLVLRYADGARDDIQAVRETLVTRASGARLPLHALAEVRRDRGPNTVSRDNVQRRIVVSASVAGPELRSVADAVRPSVAHGVELPGGYRVEYGGHFESAEQATRTLTILGAGVVAGIFLLLYVAFYPARDATLVMLNLPLALIGGVIGVFAARGVVSVATLLAFITLFGIATRNGVMLIAHVRHLVEVEGVTRLPEAVRRGAMERLAPVLMTALSAGLALIALALAGGEPGSEIQTPMAIVILWGLLSSTALNMVVVPALYLRFGALTRRAAATGALGADTAGPELI